jgi:hypothetical protein
MNNFLKALEDESSSGISRIFLRMSLANTTKGSNLEPRETLREKKGRVTNSGNSRAATFL